MKSNYFIVLLLAVTLAVHSTDACSASARMMKPAAAAKPPVEEGDPCANVPVKMICASAPGSGGSSSRLRNFDSDCRLEQNNKHCKAGVQCMFEKVSEYRCGYRP